MNLATIATLALLFGGGDEETAITVRCKADADIRGAEVLLRDIADVKSDDFELTERLLGVTFGRRPAVGYHRVLSHQDIMMRLAREGLRTERIKLSGPEKVVLHPKVVRIMPQDILDVADPVLAAALELEPQTDIEFEPMTQIRPVLVPPGRFSMDLSARLRDGRIQHSSATIEIRVLVDDTEFKVLRVPYRLRRYQQILVVANAIRKGTPLNDQNLRLSREEAPQGTSPYVTTIDAVLGGVAARDLQAGTKLTIGAVAAPAVIYKGDQVNLVSVSGRIQVATRAVALSDGPVGARIPVRNLTANKVVQAEIRGRGLVVIQPQGTR